MPSIRVGPDAVEAVGALKGDGTQASWEGWGCSCYGKQPGCGLGREKAGWHPWLEKSLALENHTSFLLGKEAVGLFWGLEQAAASGCHLLCLTSMSFK